MSKFLDEEGLVQYNKKVNNKISNINSQLEENIKLTDNTILRFGKITLPNDFKNHGIELVRGANGKVKHNINFDEFNFQHTYYFDTNNGNDSTGDGAKENPFKTLGKTFKVIEDSIDNSFKIIGKGRLFRDECWRFVNDSDIWTPTFTNKTIYLTTEQNELIISNAQSSERITGYNTNNNILNWTKVDNIYKTNRSLLTNIVDINNKDFYGFGKPLENVNTLEKCKIKPNSYYFLSSGDVYVNTIDSRQPDDNLLVCPYTPLFKVKLINSKLYMKNIYFVGGNNMNCDGVCEINGDINSKVIGVNCKASGGNLTLVKGGTNYHNNTNGFSFRDLGFVAMIQSKTSYTNRDGFNYHYYNISSDNIRECLAFEYECEGHQSGYMDTNTNNQLSTTHEGINCLRIGCVGDDCGGNVFEDINDPYSICIDCHSGENKIKDSSSYDGGYRFNGTNGTGKALLIHCSGFGNKHSITGSTNFPVFIKEGFFTDGIIKDVDITIQ